MRRHRARNTAWQVPAAARPILAPERTALESGRSWAVSAARTSRNDLCGLPAPHPADEGTEARGRKATRSGHTLSQRPGVGLMTITTTIATPMPAAVGSTPAPRARHPSAPAHFTLTTPPGGGGHAVTVPTLQMKKRGFREKCGAGGQARSTCRLPCLLAAPAPDGHLTTRPPL